MPAPVQSWKSNIVNIGCELLNLRGHFTFGRINPHSKTKAFCTDYFIKSLSSICLAPFANLYLFFLPTDCKNRLFICFTFNLNSPTSETAHKVHYFYDTTEFAQKYYIIQISLERCLSFRSEVMALVNHCCPESLLPWEQQSGN